VSPAAAVVELIEIWLGEVKRVGGWPGVVMLGPGRPGPLRPWPWGWTPAVDLVERVLAGKRVSGLELGAGPGR